MAVWSDGTLGPASRGQDCVHSRRRHTEMLGSVPPVLCGEDVVPNLTIPFVLQVAYIS